MYDLILEGGKVFCPEKHAFRTMDMAISAGRISALGALEGAQAKKRINASGFHVAPGFVDYHAHIMHGAHELGNLAEMVAFPHGVTTLVDAGSAGVFNYPALHTEIARTRVRVKAQLNIASVGQLLPPMAENIDPQFYSPAIPQLCQRHAKEIVGLKLRASKGMMDGLDATPLERALEIAEETGLPLCVHVTNPGLPMERIVSMLRAGDIVAHIHHGTGDTILDASGRVKKAFFDAQERGVIFDVAKGLKNWTFAVARASLEQGLHPHLLSSDMTPYTLNQDMVFGLPLIMSLYLNLGWSLEQVLAAVTTTPARLLGLEKDIGALAPGMCADITVFDLKEQRRMFYDSNGESMEGHRLIIPRMTIKDGNIQFRTLDI